MTGRVPLLVAVVGALLVGGATTGSTHAGWVGQRSLAATSVGSGAMSFTATTPAGVSVPKAAGATASTSFVVDDTSLGKNLSQRTTASVTSKPDGVSATVGTVCGGGQPSVVTTPTSPDQTFCVLVTSSQSAIGGNVVISLSSAQQPSGWSTPVTTRSFMVTVTGEAPATPSLSCSAPTSNPPGYRLSWNEVSGASYRVYATAVGGLPTGPYQLLTATPDTSYVVRPGGGETRHFKVTAVNAGGESAMSNSRTVIRAAGNSSVVTCL